MTISIPRAGFYYLYRPFWKAFYERLGFEVAESPKTTKDILDKGLRLADNEMCLPVKIFHAHVLYLKEKFPNNRILVPQMDEVFFGDRSRGTSKYFCPYFVGMPDVLRAELPETKLLSPVMSFYEGEIEKEPWIKFAKQKVSGAQAEKIVDKALKSQKDFEVKVSRSKILPTDIIDDEKNTPLGKKIIGVVGRPYTIYEDYCNLDLMKKISNHNLGVETPEMVPSEVVKGELEELGENKRSHWHLTNREIGAMNHFSKREDVVGIIYLIPFNCGPDFLVEEIFVKNLRRKKPVIVLSMDESTNEALFQTRLEAFFDML
ncbi:MAG: hypothetical protein ACD_11C00149G0003 [uncultured bacterium]|nr:MAG: hypothetical protein ACD_11C00149G0003 [uncultured bacterium]